MCLMSGVMHTLSATSRASPVCRKAALFAMLQKQKEHGFSVVFVKKVHHIISSLSQIQTRCLLMYPVH